MSRSPLRKRNPKLRSIMKNGYVRIHVGDKWVYEHRHVFCTATGLTLGFNDTIHHINGDKTDNRLENLKLIPRSEHGRLDAERRWSDPT